MKYSTSLFVGLLIFAPQLAHAQLKDAPRLVAQVGQNPEVVGFAPNGRWVVTGDKAAVLWDLATGLELRRFEVPDTVRAFSFDADSRKLLISTRSPNEKPKAYLFEVATGANLGQITGVSLAVFSPDGKTILAAGHNGVKLLAADGRQEIRKFDGYQAKGDPKKKAKAPAMDEVRTLAFSPDGSLAVSAGEGSTAHIALLPVIWEVATGKKLHTLTGFDEPIGTVAFHRDGKLLVTASADDTVRLWNVNTGKEVRRYRSEKKDDRNSTAFSPDGSLVLVANYHRVIVLKTKDLSVVRTLRGQPARVDNTYGPGYNWNPPVQATFSPDGKLIAGVGGGLIYLWDAASGQQLKTLIGQAARADAFALSPDGRRLVSVGHNGYLHVWDLTLGREIRRLYTGLGGNTWNFSPDCRLAYVNDSLVSKAFDVERGQELPALTARLKNSSNVRYSPDGKWVLTGDKDRVARLWDAKVWESGAGKEVRQFTGHEGPFRDVRFLVPDKTIYTDCQTKKSPASRFWDSHITRVWDSQTGKEVLQETGLNFNRSADGSRLVGHDWARDVRHLFDGATGQKLATVKDKGTPLALAPNGRLLASADDGVVVVNPLKGKEFYRFPKSRGPEFSPDGRYLLVVRADANTAHILNAQTGQELHKFPSARNDDAPERKAPFSADSRFVLITAPSGFSVYETQTGKEFGHFNIRPQFVRGGNYLVVPGFFRLEIHDLRKPQLPVTLINFREKNAWAVADTRGRFDAANGGDVDGLHWVVGFEPVALSQLKERYYDPGLLAKFFGHNAETLRAVEKFKEAKLFPDAKLSEPTRDGRMTIELANRGGGIGKVQVFVNGKELLADARGQKSNPQAQKATLTVDLAGAPSLKPGESNVVEVVTWNSDGYLSSRGLVKIFTPPGKVEQSLELHAIVVGVSEYANPALNLRYSAKDAEDMARALELGAKRLFGANKVHLTLLTSAKTQTAPNRANIQKAFELARNAKPGDVLIIYLAGHGVSLATGADLYCYLTADARTADVATLSDPALLAQYTITSAELTEWIKKIPALKQVMILDTCAAGAAAKKLTEQRNVTGDQIRAIERLKDRTGFHVLMGCASDKVSYEATQFEQGLLTHALLKGMRGAALDRDEYVDVAKLFQYAADEVPELARNIGGIQKPLIAAPRGTSFDVGRLTKADRPAIPLAMPKPLLLRPLLLNPDDGDDTLGLMPLLRKKLAEEGSASTRGAAAVFVDADELPGAIRPTGTYTVSNNTVRVRLLLRRDGTTLATLQVDGLRDDLPGLVSKMTAAIGAAVR